VGCNTEGCKKIVETYMFLMGDKWNGKLIFLFEAISWTLWLNRNGLVFNSKIILTPGALIYKCVSFLQHWVIAVTRPDREGREKLAEALTERMDAGREVAGVG
jgi:hypothetical protein